ncbi:MAG: phosphoribosyltransferase family protein, partial [Candidatus Micrarchaeota archaeon]|nr:phosphoribosyltransferase family protein [Candidatus Micrarchaeota archaeon]
NLGAMTDGEALFGIKKAYADAIASLLKAKKLEKFDFIFGPAYKGIPLAALICEGLSTLHKINVRYIYDRKEEKTYGDKALDKFIVGGGYFRAGQSILVVDDVITTGGTKEDAMEKLNALGEHRIASILVAMDRQERMGDAANVSEKSASQELSEKFGIPVYSIATASGIFEFRGKTFSPAVRNAWLEYFKKYGAVKLG